MWESSKLLIQKLIIKLNSTFSLEDISQLDFLLFLGIDVEHLSNGFIDSPSMSPTTLQILLSFSP